MRPLVSSSLGTPHRGQRQGDTWEDAGDIDTVCEPSTSSTSVERPSNELEYAPSINYKFRFQLPDYELYSYFELRPSKGASTLV